MRSFRKTLFLIAFFLSFGLFGSISISQSILSSSISPTYTANTIVAYEYWFDNNYAQKVYQTVAPVSVLTVSTSIATGTMNSGVHSFNIRYKDQYNNWSLVNSDIFYKPISTNAQTANTLVRYEYWFDNNYAQKVSQSITPTQAFVLTSSIATGTMNPGVHSFNIRFKDNYNNWSIVESQLFYKPIPSTNQSANSLVKYEYWFDNNYAQKVTQTITPTQAFVLTSSIATGTMNSGVHSFNIRFKDNYNNWSIVQSQLFYKPIASTNQTGNTLVKYEYWFDNSYAQKVTQAITPTQAFVLTSSIPTSTMNPGVHSFNIRFKDNFNNWSIVQTSLFYKPLPNTTFTNNTITQYEYWFNNNYTQKITQTIVPSAAFVLNTAIGTPSVTAGLNTFNIRFKDAYNNWSIVQSSMFYKAGTYANLASNKVIAYRYWRDTLISARTNVTLSNPVPAYSLNAPISMTAVPKGKHLFNIQFKDSTNKWSVVQADSFMKASLPIASFNVNNTVFCDSGVVSFSNTSIDGDTYAWNFGDNTTSTLTSVTHTYNTIGNYTASLVITDTITNQTSSYSMAITVSGKPVFSLGNDISICPSASITFSAPLGMQSYSWSTGSTAYSLQPVNAGTIWCTATNTNGCSYTDTLVFGFIPLPTAQFNHSANGMLVNFYNTSASALTYTWNFGDTQTSNLANPVHTYTLPGSYTVTLVVANSCGTSTITDIVTVSDVGMAQLSLQNKVMVFPNPNRGEFELYLEMNDEEQVTVGLWSLDGKLLEERTLLLSHGALQQTYRLEDWSNGVYHLVITGNKNRVVKKVIVAK